MGIFGKVFSSTEPTADEKLAIGDINWRLKPEIFSTKEYPNFLKAIKKIEDDNNIQFGLHNDIVDEIQKTIVVRNTIYDRKGQPKFTFLFMSVRIKNVDGVTFGGYVANFFKIDELDNLIKEFLVQLHSNNNDDLEIEEYEKFYNETLVQSLSIRGYNPADYLINREGEAECMYKLIEKDIRNKYK